MIGPWLYHGWTMGGPWVDHGWTMAGPWLDHGLTMARAARNSVPAPGASRQASAPQSQFAAKARRLGTLGITIGTIGFVKVASGRWQNICICCCWAVAHALAAAASATDLAVRRHGPGSNWQPGVEQFDLA